MNLKPIAYAASKKLKAGMSPDEARDTCDIVSGGELDCVQLDILADMAEAMWNEANEGGSNSLRLIDGYQTK